MDEKMHQKMSHRVFLTDRKRMELTGITDVISFDLNKVVLETEYGLMTIKGSDLHVNRLYVEKGELDIDGKVESLVYSQSQGIAKKNETFMGRLFK